MINPDTLRQIKLANCGRRCNDFGADCRDVTDKLACWMRDTTQGVCPYLTGEMEAVDAKRTWRETARH